MNVALVYDRLYPRTIGGLERYYDGLARGLLASHSVSYITRSVEGGDSGDASRHPYRIIEVAPASAYYGRGGKRRLWPPVRFGIGVFLHLLRHARSYDVVQCASFPFFSVIASRLALSARGRRAKLVVDWLEIWTLEYWITYAGPVAGRIGYLIQQVCMRAPDYSLTYSKLHLSRLPAHRSAVTRLTGLAADLPTPRVPSAPRLSGPLVVFAGRHIPDKQPSLVPAVIREARRKDPSIRCLLIGDGPEHGAVASAIREEGLEDAIDLPGFVRESELAEALGNAACLLLPSMREGYGLIVIEAAAFGTPCVTIDSGDNAAKELIEPGVNGFVAADSTPPAVAAAVIEVIRRGRALRESTLRWCHDNWAELSIESSVRRVGEIYDEMVFDPS
jgi:glycosyltransferase involved in cell wall biosynthesis